MIWFKIRVISANKVLIYLALGGISIFSNYGINKLLGQEYLMKIRIPIWIPKSIMARKRYLFNS
jgi:hypothetical protein